MQYAFPERVERLKEYLPQNTAAEIRLDSNESFCRLDSALLEKIKAEIDGFAFNRYPDPSARDLCLAFAERYGVDPRKLVAGNGSDELISLIMSTFFERGDRILVFEPDFSMYAFYARLADVEVKTCERDLDKAARLIEEEKVKAVIFSNPCNPTGGGFTAEQMRAFAEATPALVILDEAYMDFWEESLLKQAGEIENLIILRTLSKAVGLAALRVGFMAAAPQFVAVLMKCKSPYNLNALSARIAEIVLRDAAYLESAKARLLESRGDLGERLRTIEKNTGKIEVFDSTANFFYIRSDYADRLYKAAADGKVAIRFFGGGYLRISCGTKNENYEICDIFETILEGC